MEVKKNLILTFVSKSEILYIEASKHIHVFLELF